MNLSTKCCQLSTPLFFNLKTKIFGRVSLVVIYIVYNKIRVKKGYHYAR